jgi:hypothetical protein
MPQALSTRDPDQMTDTERIGELARLLAAAILRLRSRPTSVTTSSSKTLDSSATPLELSARTRLSGTTG